MIREIFLGKSSSNFHINSVVKSFIVSDSLLWSAWNLVAPIFAVFIVNDITGGSVQMAASAYSTYLISRVIFEVLTGRYLVRSSNKAKFITTILGMLVMSVAYIGFGVSSSIEQVFIFYALAGAGIGIASPAKNSLFSMNLDKNKEAAEWGLTDAVSFMCMAIATAVGGFIAEVFGFKTLFYAAAIVNIIGIIPFLLLVNKRR